MIEVTLPDKSIKKIEQGSTIFDVANMISPGLARQAIGGKVNDEIVDLDTIITKNSSIEILTSKSKESLDILRHTTAHIFAQAILRVFPDAKITIGPSTESGFFYDIDYDQLTEEDFPVIEKEMSKIISENYKISRNYKTNSQAKEFFKNNKYKLEIIEAITSNKLKDEEKLEGKVSGDKLQFYKQGEFEDICTGPHLPNTGLVKAFKLEKITRAYWRGDSKNKQLNRVYGTAFWKKSDMDEYFKNLEEAKKRDHRILGKKLDYFMNHEFSPGMPFFLPRGFSIWKSLQEFMREQYEIYGYKEVMTPNIFNSKLWKISGHWDHYKDDLFMLKVDDQDFAIKPMNCPSHCLIFKNTAKSYRDLPLRIADFGALHRNELSGTLSGLTRVRKFSQDDGHIFCSIEQVEDEISKLLKLVDYVYKEVFNMTYEIELSTRPENSIGSDKNWEDAENALKSALKKNNREFEICEGDGAFYGPKIDFRMKDCINRVWQTATIQLDFNLPERFDLKYEGPDNKQHRPVMIHRAILGSLERFMGILIEHFEGKFPLWLSPCQIKLINVADRHIEYCDEIKKVFIVNKFKVETSYENIGVGKKIALAREEDKPNYMIIIGDQNVTEKTISIRTRKFINGKNEEFTTTLEEFLKKIILERKSKQITF